ncbi:hypothetical protein K9M47_04195 [Candidatus Gracilibacteria bacterium]|nr:hypothetical protein [Candidatus Gracilibacteria bacterium]MCF7898555.1 hypothetical protein [Candidatus Paceibacterota bacterium]
MSKDKPGFTNTGSGIAGQGVSDVIAGIKQGNAQNGTPDFSRASAYSGSNSGVHTGSNTPTTGRHGGPFGKK